MRVMLVDDNRLMLEGLQNLLEAHGIEVSGTASDGLEAVEMSKKLSPDVILMDIRMPECDGLCATKIIKADRPDSRIVILTTSTEDSDLFEAVKSGASGYLLKSISADELVEALEQVQEGTPPFSPGLATKLLAEFTRLSEAKTIDAGKASERKEDAGTVLNRRQLEVLELVASGMSYKEAGAKLFLSPRTVKYHMAEIMDKLHLENRAQVLTYAGQIRNKMQQK